VDGEAFKRFGCPFSFMKSEVPITGWKELVLLYVGKRIGFEVDGDSMTPTLKTGDRVLIDPSASIEIGDIVLANHPYKKNVRMVKRVSSIDPDGNHFLAGDNPAESTDSQTFGKIPAKDILGKVVSRK
jgi:nickel-type superoxide dismutase maturation protease